MGADRNPVAVIMGSQSDWETMRHARDTLNKYGVTCECRVLSAHRTPHETADFVRSAEQAGTRVFIAAAGGAAHLAGVVAAHTVRPVLGVPMPAWSLDGRRLAFGGAPDGADNWDLWMVDLPSLELHRLTRHASYDGGPVFVPGSALGAIDSATAP